MINVVNIRQEKEGDGIVRIKLPVILGVLLLLATGGLQAYDVFLYNLDPSDMIWDPVLSDSIDCSYWIEQTLIAMGDDVTVSDSMPSDLIGSYDMVFVTTGFYPYC